MLLVPQAFLRILFLLAICGSAALVGAQEVPDTTGQILGPAPEQPRIDSTRGGLLQTDSATPHDARTPDTGWVDLSARPDAPKHIPMTSRIGEYYLYWNTLYSLTLANDGVAVIEPPAGFTILSAIIGNGKLFALQQEKNRITLKKLAFNDVGTNLVLVMAGPSGDQHSLNIDVRAGKTTTSIARFVVPTNRSVNQIVEQVKSRYMEQMNGKLRGQNETLNKSVWEEAMAEQQIFRIPQDLDETEESWKGASYRIDAITNSRDEAFVYTSTDANDRECQVVDLVTIESKDGVIKKHAELWRTKKVGKRTQLIYRTSRMTEGNWMFHVKIWSKEFVIKTILQSGDK